MPNQFAGSFSAVACRLEAGNLEGSSGQDSMKPTAFRRGLVGPADIDCGSSDSTFAPAGGTCPDGLWSYPASPLRTPAHSEPARDLAGNDLNAEEIPSVGSKLHSSGECRPCAWFWKPQGCHHGQSCNRCHLCPIGEIKARKKQKLGSLQATEDAAASRPAEVGLQNMVAGDVYQLGGLAQVPKSLSDATPQLCVATASLRVPPPSYAPPPAPPTLPPKLPAGMCEVSLPLDPPFATSTVMSPAPTEVPLLSKGSSLHASGMCSPCAWFWKPQGCQNGKNCSRCHLCPPGEVKTRKKAKITALRVNADVAEQRDHELEIMARRIELQLLI